MGKKILSSTLDAIENEHYYVSDREIEMKLKKQQMETVKCYLPNDVYDYIESYESSEIKNTKCYVYVTNQDSFEAAQDILKSGIDKKVAVLNFANPVNPGGGVRHGAMAQEELLCLRSTLLKSLESPEAIKYYDYNRNVKTFAGSDAIMLTENVEVIKDRCFNFLDNSFLVSVITCAAPMVSPISHRLEDTTQEQMEAILYRRIVGILATLICNNYKKIVLGAWGCGAFGNDAMTVAKIFKKAFDDMKIDFYFDEICFAILTKDSTYNLEAFLHYFSQ